MLRVTSTMTGVQGAPFYQTFYFGGTTAPEALVAAAAVRAFWSSMSSHIGSPLSIQVETAVDQVDEATGETTGTFNAPTAAVACSGGTVLPPVVQALGRLRTGVYYSGREVRGRVFLPRIQTSANTVGMPNATLITPFTSALTALLTASSAAGNLGVYSKKNFALETVNSVDVWNQFAELRSRRD